MTHDAGQYRPGAGQYRPGEIVPLSSAAPSGPYGQAGPYGYPAQPIYLVPLKDTGVAYLLWFFLGGFGAHQFYLGRIGWGVAYLGCWLAAVLTIWIFIGLIPLLLLFVGWLIDLFMIPSFVRDANARATGLQRY